MKVTATAPHALGHRLTLRRSTAVRPTATVTRLATASVLAALAVAGSAGTAAASPIAAPAPQFSWSGTESNQLVGGLDGLLLNAREVSRIAGTTTELREGKLEQTLSNTYSVTPARCLSAYAPGQTAAYLDGAPGKVAFKSVGTPRDAEEDRVAVREGVVEFSSKKDALAFMSSTASAWDSCAGETVTEAEGGSWEMGQPQVNDERTMVTLGQQSTRGSATCERAMAAYRNVFIDVMYCSPDNSTRGQAAAVVSAIAEKAASS